MYKKLIVTILLFTFLMATFSIEATETRSLSMGQTGKFTNDNSNVIPFPGNVIRFNNEVYTELRFADFPTTYTAGVRMPVLQSNFVVGVNLNRPLMVDIDPLNVGTEVTLNRTTDILFGMDLAGFDFGARLSYAADSYTADSTQTTPETDETARYIELAGGISNETLDAGVAFMLPSVTSERGDLKDDMGGFGVNAIGRYFHKLNSKMKVVPVVEFGLAAGLRELDPGPGLDTREWELAMMNLSFAGAIHYQLNEDHLLILGLEVFGLHTEAVNQKDVVDSTRTVTTLPGLYLGAESRLASWLKGRLGAYQKFQTTTTEVKPDGGDTYETSSSAADVFFNFGVGIEIGNFLIDLNFDEGLFFDGPNFISGQSRDWVTQLSITYNFNEPKKEE